MNGPGRRGSGRACRRRAIAPRRALCLSLAVGQVCLAVLPQAVQAAYRGRLYYMDRPKLGLDLSYRLDSEERSSPFNKTKLETHVLSERIELETEGWVYHPAMALYTLSLAPEFRQTRERPEPGRDNDQDSTLLDYGIDVTLLPYKPYTLDLYARRQNTELTSSLAPVTEVDSESYGGSLKLKYKVLPTILSYDHSIIDQTGFYESHEVRDEARLNMRHDRQSNDTQANLSYQKVDRTASGQTTNTESLFGSLFNSYRILPDNRMVLNSLASYRETDTNLIESSGVLVSETLNWRHSKRLSSNYNLQYSKDEFAGQSLDQTMASAGLSHFLYENLTTSASVDAGSSSRGEDYYGGNVNFDYQRRIPWGMVYANMGHNYRVTTRSEGGLPTPVLAERHPIGRGLLTVLNNLNVDRSYPVIVTNADGSITYDEGLDYTLVTVGMETRIEAVPFGRLDVLVPITIAVTYTYQSNPPYDDALYTQTYGIGLHLWSAWRINYRYSHSKQDLLDGIPPPVLNEDTTHSADTELVWKWSTTRALFEDSERNSGASMRRWRVEETVTFQPWARTFLSASAYYGETEQKDNDARDTFHGLRGELQWMPTSRSRYKLEALYAVMEGTSVDTIDQGVAATWEWSLGIWKADASYRFLNQEDRNIGQTRDRHTVFVSIRRSLW